MTDALTPAVAVAYLRELSADVRAVLVLGPAGEHLAGDAALAAPALTLLGDGEGAAEAEGRHDGELLFAARDDRHALAVACGRLALPGLVRHDLRTVLARLASSGA
jgi:hypothetical protein